MKLHLTVQMMHKRKIQCTSVQTPHFPQKTLLAMTCQCLQTDVFQVQDHMMAGIEEIIGRRGNNFWRVSLAAAFKMRPYFSVYSSTWC
jgi:hypothetical protein